MMKSKSLSIDQKIRIKDLKKKHKVEFYRMPKVYTVKEWKKLKKTNKKLVHGKEYYFDLQEFMCKKYDIILIDHRTKKEIAIGILKGINFENFDKGMDIFDGAMKEFDKAMKDFGKELGGSNVTPMHITGNKKIVSKKLNIWGTSTRKKSSDNFPKIWSDTKPTKKKRKSKKSKKSTSTNMDKIWGKKRVTLL